MFYIFGKIADHSIVEKNGVSSSVNIDQYKANIATNHGGVASDYCYYALEDSASDTKRILAGDEHTFIWENDEITGVDFSIEDNRKLFTIKTVDPDNKSVVKDTIVGDNTDAVIIQTRTCLADETLDTSINATTLIPVTTPDNRTVYLKVTVTNGVGNEITFKTALEGIWTVKPGNIMVGSDKMRLWGVNGPGATNTINVLMDL